MTATSAATAPPPSGATAPSDPLELADWRRQVSDLYATIRAQSDPCAAWREWCEVRTRLFRKHPQTPLSNASAAALQDLPCFPYDPAWRFVVSAVPMGAVGNAQPIDVELGADGKLTLHPAARTDGLARALGTELTLYWIAGYGGGLFLPFGDRTNMEGATYGGGRYLLDTIKGADLGMQHGKLVIDFNYAYNPSCAYDARWTCPLTPMENRVPVAVRAGEQAPGRTPEEGSHTG